MADMIQIRRDTAANWTTANPILAQGELGAETDTSKIKIGDGTTAWTSLSYLIDTSIYLTSSAIGSTIQAYDVNNTTATNTQTLTNKTITETVFALATSGTVALDSDNGGIQTAALTGAITFTDSINAGQSIVLMITGGDANVITWPTLTWVTSGGNVAPTSTASDTFVLWKIDTTLYGAYVGNYV